MIALRTSIELPEWLESSGVALRTHNTIVKSGISEELQIHLDKTIPKHFLTSARGRYKYQPRTAKYQSYKIKNRGKTVGETRQEYATDAHLDLVKSGRTRREIRSGAKMTTGGSGSLVRGLLRLKVPIAGSTGRELNLAAQLRLIDAGKRKSLANRLGRMRLNTVRRTVNEIERFADDEVAAISQRIANRYAAFLSKRGRRVKKTSKGA